MIHRDVIAEVARRLPHRTQREVAEVIEVQDMKAGGALNQYGRLRRVYRRFRPTESLKMAMQEVDLEQA